MIYLTIYLLVGALFLNFIKSANSHREFIKQVLYWPIILYGIILAYINNMYQTLIYNSLSYKFLILIQQPGRFDVDSYNKIIYIIDKIEICVSKSNTIKSQDGYMIYTELRDFYLDTYDAINRKFD